MSTLQKIWDNAVVTALTEYVTHIDALAEKREPIPAEDFVSMLEFAKEHVYGDVTSMANRLLKSRAALYQIMAKAGSTPETSKIGMVMMISADAKIKITELNL